MHGGTGAVPVRGPAGVCGSRGGQLRRLVSLGAILSLRLGAVGGRRAAGQRRGVTRGRGGGGSRAACANALQSKKGGRR